MKRLFSFLAAVLMTSAMLAESVNVYLTNGKNISGVLIRHDANMLVIEPNTIVKYEKKITPNEVLYYEISEEGRYVSKDGQFVFDESTKIIPVAQDTVITAKPIAKKAVMPSNPNEVIGRAMTTCGGVALGIGVPVLTVGTILTIAGHVMHTDGLLDPKTKTKQRCCEAGCYLMPIGASLTIIGIPLMVEGRKIMDLKINYTGNGVGLALEL